jgi:hypothetical protein
MDTGRKKYPTNKRLKILLSIEAVCSSETLTLLSDYIEL